MGLKNARMIALVLTLATSSSGLAYPETSPTTGTATTTGTASPTTPAQGGGWDLGWIGLLGLIGLAGLLGNRRRDTTTTPTRPL